MVAHPNFKHLHSMAWFTFLQLNGSPIYILLQDCTTMCIIAVKSFFKLITNQFDLPPASFHSYQWKDRQ